MPNYTRLGNKMASRLSPADAIVGKKVYAVITVVPDIGEPKKERTYLGREASRSAIRLFICHKAKFFSVPLVNIKKETDKQVVLGSVDGYEVMEGRPKAEGGTAVPLFDLSKIR